MRALLALEDGAVFTGRACGFPRDTGGEVVFNTAMTGYQEILTDPSYYGQIVVFTAPHVGNYGIHPGQGESSLPRAAGLIAREVCGEPSHPDSIQSLPSFLKEHGVFGLSGVDTRALTLHLRSHGSLRGWLTTAVALPEQAVQKACEVPPIEEIPAVPLVSAEGYYRWDGVKRRGHEFPRVAVLDCGVKFAILRELSFRGCRVHVFPAETPAEAIERFRPDGLVLSNGPGDPRSLRGWLPRIGRLMEHRPTLAVCLGHQLASLVLGCRVVKLPFGHHGANHPVKDLRSGRVLITSQNHNYAVDAATMPAETEITHVNLNDGTVEGLRHRSLPLWSVQFHPEASPGPHEATAAFDGFVSALTSRREEALGQDASGPDRMA